MIEFKDVSMKYKANDVLALDRVSVRIEDGEFVFIVGASGAGKSSFLNVIMGQERVDEGNVIVGPYNLSKIKKKELPYLRRMLGIVFQDFRLIPKMTVYDNIAFALRVIGIGERIIRKRVRYVLRLVDLSSKAKFLPNQLSTGERQRVAIARALVNNPGVIIADEPTGNLDPVLSGEIMSLFDKINALGATVVVVTHDLELVRQFDHRVVTIENGKIISDVPPRMVQPPQPQVQPELQSELMVELPEDVAAMQTQDHEPSLQKDMTSTDFEAADSLRLDDAPQFIPVATVDPTLSADEMIAAISNQAAQPDFAPVADASRFAVEDAQETEDGAALQTETEVETDGE